MKQLIEDLISALEYHVEQTRPIYITTVALQAAREALKSLPPQRKPLTDAQSERLYRNIEPSRQQDARSLAAFKRLLRVIEAAHGIKGESP